MTDAIGLDLLESNPDQEAIAQARAEERRQSAIQLVNSIYRLIKVLGIHAESNQAVAVLVTSTVAAVSDYCQKASASSASVLFADDTIFVNGQMLRASREAYGTAVALGALFQKCGISEVTFQANLDASQAMEFARALHAALRDRSLAATITEQVIPGVKLRRIDGRTTDADNVEEAPLAERIAQTYAASIVVMRAFYAELARGQNQLPHRIKRVAQKLVKDAEEAPYLVLSLAASRGKGADDAGIAVASACLSILVARQLTSDRAMLGNLATTALLFDVGRPRLAGSQGEMASAGIQRVLNDDQLDRLPASTAAVLTVLGRMHTASITRTVVTFEALWSRRAARLGPLYGGRRTPTMLARIVSTTRTFIELVTPTPTAPALAFDDAVHLLTESAASEIDRACVKLLVATLGFFPVGTVVELNTGELAIVTAVPSLPVRFARPPIRLMYDEAGNLLPEPLDLDLASPPPPGHPARYVRRTVEYDAQQMRAMRSFILTSVSGKRPAQHPALLRPTSEPASGSTPAPLSPATANERMKTGLTPAPRSAAHQGTQPLGPATRQVSWEEYQKLATPQPRIVSAPRSSSPPFPPPPQPAGSATRQVSWDEYQKLATPQPRIVAAPPPRSSAPPSPPAPQPAGSATRQVSWDEYQKLATPQPRIVASPVSEPALPETRALDWEESESLRISRPPSTPRSQPRDPAPAATRQVDWSDYQALASAPPPPSASPSAIESAPLELPPWSDVDEIPPEQDDTDLLLAGVEQDDDLPPGFVTPKSTDELDNFFRAYLDEEPMPQAPSVRPPLSPPPPVSPTRHIRWAATEALLSELEGDSQKPKTDRPAPPRPGPPRPKQR